MNVSAHQRIPSFLPLRAELPLFAYLVTESLVSNRFPAVQLSCECLLSVHLVLSDWFVVFRLSTEASSDHNLTAAFFPFSCSEELVNLLHTVVIRFLPVPKDRISADHFPINSFSRFQAGLRSSVAFASNFVSVSLSFRTGFRFSHFYRSRFRSQPCSCSLSLFLSRRTGRLAVTLMTDFFPALASLISVCHIPGEYLRVQAGLRFSATFAGNFHPFSLSFRTGLWTFFLTGAGFDSVFAVSFITISCH